MVHMLVAAPSVVALAYQMPITAKSALYKKKM